MQATTRPGDAFASDFQVLDAMGAMVCQAYGSGSGYGLSPNGKPLTTKVDLLPKGMSFAGHVNNPNEIWVSIQGHCFRAYITRLLTRDGRTMTADETTQVENMRSISLLAGRFNMSSIAGPTNVWDIHPFGVYQSEAKFWSTDVSGQGDTADAVRNRLKNSRWSGWAGDTQSANVPTVKYSWDSTNHEMVWMKNGAVTRYAAVLNSMKVGGAIDLASSTAAMEADVTLTEENKIGFRKQVSDLIAAYGALVVFNTFNDVHADYGLPVSGVTWVNAHVNAETSKIASMLLGIVTTLFTPFTKGDLVSYGISSEVTGVTGATI